MSGGVQAKSGGELYFGMRSFADCTYRQLPSIDPLTAIDALVLRTLWNMACQKPVPSRELEFELDELWDALQLSYGTTSYASLRDSMKRLSCTVLASRQPDKAGEDVLRIISSWSYREIAEDGIRHAHLEFDERFREDPERVMEMIASESEVA